MDATSDRAPKLTGAFDLFSKSSALVQNNLTTFVILYLIPLLSNAGRFMEQGPEPKNQNVSSINFSNLPNVAIGSIIGLGAILVIMFVILVIITTLMMTVLQLRAAQNQKPTLSQLWPETKKYGLRLIGLGLLVGLVVVLGLIAFIVPGLIFIRRYFLAPYVLIDQDVSITTAMRRSADLSKPHSGSVWGVIGVSFLIGLLGIIPFIGWILSAVMGLLYSVAPALRYEELKHLPTASHPVATTE